MSHDRLEFEIMFDDLTPKAQKEFLDWSGLKTPAEANLDIMPLAVLPPYEEE